MSDHIDDIRFNNAGLHGYNVAELCEEIQTLLKKQTDPDNILLVGSTGAGKSSLVNALLQALSKKRTHPAEVGFRTDGRPKTESFIRYEMHRVSSTDSQSFPECQNMPNIVDMSGYAGQDFKHWKKILLAALLGKIPDQTSIEHSLRTVHDHPDYFDGRDTDEARKVSKIIFVARADEDINVQLLKTVVDVARGGEADGLELPVYAVLTHYDRVGEDENSGVSLRDATTKIEKLTECLEIQGSQDEYLTTFCNYSDTVKPINPNIERTTLNLLRMIHVHRPKSTPKPLPPDTSTQGLTEWVPCILIIGGFIMVAAAILKDD